MLKGLSRFERKQVMQERSREWAWGWNGKHVVVTYDVAEGAGMKSKTCRIKEMAYFGSKHEDIGWGRVRVVIDQSELSRVTYDKHPYYKGEKPIVDGFGYGGINIVSHLNYDRIVVEDPLAFYINWGDRNRFILDEVDEEAEALAAKREQERLERKREEEIRKHFGEGI